MRQQFELKYGRAFVEKATNDYDRTVNEKIKFKLTIAKPDAMLVLLYIRQIAQEHDIQLDDNTPNEQTDSITPSAPQMYPQLDIPEPDHVPYIPQVVSFPIQPVYYGEEIQLSSPQDFNDPQYSFPDQPVSFDNKQVTPQEEKKDTQEHVLSDLERRLALVRTYAVSLSNLILTISLGTDKNRDNNNQRRRRRSS
jgi:hypothetical protein